MVPPNMSMYFYNTKVAMLMHILKVNAVIHDCIDCWRQCVLLYRQHYSPLKVWLSYTKSLLDIKKSSFLDCNWERKSVNHMTVHAATLMKSYHEEHENGTMYHPCRTGVVIAIRIDFSLK